MPSMVSRALLPAQAVRPVGHHERCRPSSGTARVCQQSAPSQIRISSRSVKAVPPKTSK